jgi:hypothetical protein
MDAEGAKEILYQLTTQLFNPGKGSKVDYYNVLGVPRSATHKVP